MTSSSSNTRHFMAFLRLFRRSWPGLERVEESGGLDRLEGPVCGVQRLRPHQWPFTLSESPQSLLAGKAKGALNQSGSLSSLVF